MKTLQTLATTLLMVMSFNAFAADDIDSDKLKMDYALNIYVDAIVHGKIKGLTNVFDNDVKYSVVNAGKVTNYTKSELLKSIEITKDIEQNCSTNYQILENNLSQSVVRVIMKYELFTKVNLINLAKTKIGWKITSISSAFN